MLNSHLFLKFLLTCVVKIKVECENYSFDQFFKTTVEFNSRHDSLH